VRQKTPQPPNPQRTRYEVLRIMVWTYDQVEELRKKHARNEEITQEELNNLKKYIKVKKQVAHLPIEEWSETQLLRAEFLLHKLTNEQKIEVQAV